MEIGRKLYFDRTNGNVLLDTGERSSDVVETTIEQDFKSFIELSARVPSTVGVIHVPYGKDRENFRDYLYHVDINTEDIVWDMTPIQYEEKITEATLSEKMSLMEDIQAQVVFSLVMGGLM